MIKEENKNKKLALDICSQFKQKVDSQTVFDFVSKSEFIQTLINLINSSGEQLYQSKNTCGIASVMHLSCSFDILNFTMFAIDLYQFGVGELNGYKVTEQHNLKKWSRKAKPKDNFTGVSLVVIGSIRFIENTSLKFKQGTMDGMTWPSEIYSLSRRILKGVLIQEDSFLLGWNLKKIEDTLSNQQGVILLYRTSSWKGNGNFFKDSWHYIILKEAEKIGKRKVKISYWDYGNLKFKELANFQFYKSVIKTFVFSNNKK